MMEHPLPTLQRGKPGQTIFLSPPVFNAAGVRTGGGAGCNGCHNAPEFDIDPNTRNNGIIGTVNSNVLDLGNTRAPFLKGSYKD